MGQKYCLTSAQWKYAQACLTLAKRFGLIDDDSPEALEKRCAAKNAETVAAERNGQVTYGTRCYNIAAYLQYELTRFRLDFVESSRFFCPDFTAEETRAFYDANRDLFTRYFNDSFSYDEVRLIIEKRLREEVYDNLVQDILCESQNR